MQDRKVYLIEINNNKYAITNTVGTFALSKLKQSGHSSAPAYKEIKQVGSFSIDGERKFCNNSDNLKFYKPPKTFPNLYEGFDKQIKKDESLDEKLEFMLHFLGLNTPLLKDVGFVLFRGLLTKIASIPYCQKEDLSFFATNYKGCIYMIENKSKKATEELNKNKEQIRAEFYGRQFENICTLSKEELQNEGHRTLPVVNINSEYCIMVKSTLGNNKLLIGAEVDCIKPIENGNKQEVQLSQYVEIKTSKQLETEKQKYTFERFKLLKFWIQSFLVGTEHIFVGFRDNEGNVKSTKMYNTRDLPPIAKKIKYGWNDQVCLNFANNLLDILKTSLKIKDSMNHTYLVVYKAQTKQISVYEYKNNAEKAFLTREFVESLNYVEK